MEIKTKIKQINSETIAEENERLNNTYQWLIDDLSQILYDIGDGDGIILLTESLHEAKKAAKSKLNNFEDYDLPISLDSYKAYLRKFAMWIPTEAPASSGDKQSEIIMNKLLNVFHAKKVI